jgi:hypothetical protein
MIFSETKDGSDSSYAFVGTTIGGGTGIGDRAGDS